MAAFSQQHNNQNNYPLFLDSVSLLNNNPIDMISCFMEELGNMDPNCPNQFYPPEPLLETLVHPVSNQNNRLDEDHGSSKASSHSDNETSVTRKQTTESSAVVNKIESVEQITQKVTQMDKKRKIRNGSSTTSSAQSKDDTEGKATKKQRKCNGGGMKGNKEENAKADKKNQKQVPEEPPTGYIHVRARRGQATDSHSLAERARREKISERMKILQRLVPGCDGVTGKALVLDEIINYVQSLQNQVEFLSMELAALNPFFCDFGLDFDAYMVRPSEGLSGMTTPQTSVAHCSPNKATQAAFVDASTITTPSFATFNDCTLPLLDTSASLLLQHGQRTNVFSQESAGLLWKVEDQRQKFLHPSGFTTNLHSLQ